MPGGCSTTGERRCFLAGAQLCQYAGAVDDWATGLERPGRHEIAWALTDAITAGAFGVGERLPSVRMIVERCGVSPNTAREALVLVAQRGHAYSPGRARYVVVDRSGQRQRLDALEQRMMAVAMGGGPDAGQALAAMLVEHREAAVAVEWHDSTTRHDQKTP